MHFQKLWDSNSQNKTSEISTHTLSELSGTLVRKTCRRKYQTNDLIEIMGLQFAEQNVGNLKTYTFKKSGTVARSKQRRKSPQIEDPGCLLASIKGRRCLQRVEILEN